jgi:probable phosphoglycerate mutase
MRALELTLVRHGETAWNAIRRIQGSIDIELNATGQVQAAAIGQALARRHSRLHSRLHSPGQDQDQGQNQDQRSGQAERFHRLISSDQTRAAQTAAAIAQATGLELTFDPELRERRYGLFEGQGYDDIETRWPADWARWQARDPAWGPPEGETLGGFNNRVCAWLDRIAGAVESSATGAGASSLVSLELNEPLRVIAVTHGGVLDMAFRHAAGLTLDAPRRHQTLNAARNVLRFERGVWEVVVWADTGHLNQPDDDL